MPDPRDRHAVWKIPLSQLTGLDTDNDTIVELAIVEISSGIYALATAPYEYNPTTLAYQKATIPYVQIDDLTVSMGDVEKLLSDNYWKDKRYEYSSGLLIYTGYNTTHKAATSAETWYIWKKTYSNNQLTRDEGPLVGAWDDRATLAWG